MENKYVFYDPQGNTITSEQFIDFYSRCYYTNNSFKAENYIIRCLSNKLTIEDVQKILAWKIGAVNKYNENENELFIVSDKKTELEYKRAKISYNESFAECITKWSRQQKWNEDSAKSFFNELFANDFSGIGTVYLLTLLFVVSKGAFPIYDRFAAQAIKAIIDNKKPYEKCEIKEPFEKCNNFSEKIFKDKSFYISYINNLEKIFGEEYKNNRKIDQALWVYGHMFKKKKATAD